MAKKKTASKKKKTKSLKKEPGKGESQEKDYGDIETKERPYDREHYVSHAKNTHRIIYWLALLILVSFNFAVFLLLVPFATILTELHRHVIIAAVGLVFGLIFNFLVIDLEHLEPKHHFAAAILIPLVAVVNILIMLSFTNTLRDIWELPKAGGAIVESLVYATFFIAPYFYSLLKGRITYT